MSDSFDMDKAEENLQNREARSREEREKLRKEVLDKAKAAIKEEFCGTNVEAYLVGSVCRPYCFHKNSDVDVVLKKFSGNRFEIWTNLEDRIGRDVEIILFENCGFQHHVVANGLKVL